MKNVIETLLLRWDRWLGGLVFGLLSVVAAVSVFQVQAAHQHYLAAIERLESGETLSPADPRGADRYEMLTLAEARQTIHPSKLITERDIFSPVADTKEPAPVSSAARQEHPDLELIDITFTPLPLQYCGNVLLPDGTLVAQVNYRKRSYLVSRGMRVGNYVVTAVDTERLVLQRDGEMVRLPYRGIAYSNERTALIQDRRGQKQVRVTTGDTIVGFQVNRITKETVLLTNMQEKILLQKGKVRP